MKILFFAEAVSFAHIGRPLVLARWAHENGVEVHFASSPEGLQKTNANSFGFATHSIYTIEGSLFYDRANHGKIFYQKNELKKYVEEERALILKIKPDLIVSDFRLTTAISSELTGKPLLNLSNSYWSPNYSCKVPAPEFGIFGLLPQKTPEFFLNIIRQCAFKFFGKELNETRVLYGLEKKNDFRKLYTDGAYTAYMDLPHFSKLNKLPENHFFLGPVIWSPETETTDSLNEKNNIYISMGSSGNNALLPQIIHSTLKNNLNVIMSGINEHEKKELLLTIPALNSRSIIKPLIQAEEILPFCKLTICHGGSGTVYQSIASGTPVLCFPKNPDQGLVSMSVVENNIGRYIPSKCISQFEIDKMIKECIANEVILQNTVNMQKEIQHWNTKSRWIQFINKFKTIRKTNKIRA